MHVALMRGAAEVLVVGGALYLYGPYRIDGAHTAPSNAAFDESLRARDARWGVRDLGEVTAAAEGEGFARRTLVSMPGNNQSIRVRESLTRPAVPTRLPSDRAFDTLLDPATVALPAGQEPSMSHLRLRTALTSCLVAAVAAIALLIAGCTRTTPAPAPISPWSPTTPTSPRRTPASPPAVTRSWIPGEQCDDGNQVGRRRLRDQLHIQLLPRRGLQVRRRRSLQRQGDLLGGSPLRARHRPRRRRHVRPNGGVVKICKGGVCGDPGCGDGIITVPEECDDSNKVDGDGCDSCRYTCVAKDDTRNCTPPTPASARAPATTSSTPASPARRSPPAPPAA